MKQPSQSPAEQTALREASHWYARLNSGIDNPDARLGWERWLSADPLHAQAWARVEQLRTQMARVPGRLASPTLQSSLHSRRRILRTLVILAGTGSLSWVGSRSEWMQTLTADYHTGVGERRELPLADGSHLWLNTETALDLCYDQQQRLIRLRHGEILVQTASDTLQRPFWVATPNGRIQALGTRFSVRIDGPQTQVAVLDKAVEIHLPGQSQPLRLQAGQQVTFNQEAFGPLSPHHANAAAWIEGSLIAINQPLGWVVQELARYRPGWLHCDPAIAHWNVSGTYPLDNTDLALAALESGFPVQIIRRTPYWVTVTAIAKNNYY